MKVKGARRTTKLMRQRDKGARLAPSAEEQKSDCEKQGRKNICQLIPEREDRSAI